MKHIIRDQILPVTIWMALLAFALFGIRACVNFIDVESEKERQETYRAWQKAYPEKDISYADWRRLKSHKLLPKE